METKKIYADTMGQISSKILTEPYSAIAPYYDSIMRDINYDEWLNYIHQILKKFKHRPSRILDLACGTGTCAISLSKKGYEVVGIDNSEAMLRIARQKTELENLRIEYIRQNMEDFFLPEKVDTIICLFDSLNYILEEEKMLDACRCAFDVLTPGGFFIFDMNTEYGLAKCWGSREFVREDKGSVSIWRNSYDPVQKIARLDLTLFVPEGNHYLRIDEVHLEKAYSSNKIRKLLKEAGFDQVYLYKHLTFRPPDSSTKRVMVVAKKRP